MKVNIILILCFFTITSLAQSKFAAGFSRGYKKGYCYGQGVNCIEPISPIPPIPRISEDLNSYEDGYNNGFDQGLKNQKNISISTRERYNTASAQLESSVQKISIGDITKLIPILKLAKEKAIEFSDNGDFLSAIKLAKSGLKLSPRDDEFMMIIGVAYLDLESYADALIYLKRAVLKTNDSEIKAVIREIESGEYQKNIENNKDN